MSSQEDSGRPGLVLTSVGPDRPGLVNALAAFVNQAGGNIEDTRMAKLGGEFAVLMLITGSERVLANLTASRAEIEGRLGVNCSLRPTAQRTKSREGLFFRFEVSGLDRPGIVESVSDVLAKRQVNVASLTSRVAHAPLTGTPMFQLEAELEVPPQLNLAHLRRDLAEACERENLDFSLQPGRA